MSEVPTPPADSTPPPASPEPAPARKTPKPGRWRRRTLVTLIVLFALATVGRLLIAILLPIVLQRVVAFYGLSCTYDRAALSMTDGNLSLSNLTLRPKGGGEPIAHAEYIYGNISPMQLLHGRLYVYRAEVDGISVKIGRNADGTIPLLARFVPATATATNATPAAGPPKTVDLTSPLKVEAFRLTHVSAHIHDEHVTPVLDTDILLGVRVSDLGAAGQATTFEVTVAADRLLDELSLKGHAKLDSTSLDSQMTVGIRGLHPRAAAGYMEPIGIRPAADDINMQMSAALTASPSSTTPGALTGKLSIDKVSAIADGEQSVRVDKVVIDIDSFDTLALKLGDVLVQGVRVSTGRTHAGLLRACGIELIPPAQPNPPAPAKGPSAGPAYGLSVASVRLSDCRLQLEDQAVTPATTLAVQLDQLTVAALPAGGPLAIVGKLTIPGVAKQVDLSGSASPFASTKSAAVMLRVSGLQPSALKPYLNAIGLESQFTNGTFACDLNADLKPTPDGNFAANAHLSRLRLADGGELLGLDDVALLGVSADASRIHFDSIAVSGPTLVIRRDAGGAVSLLGFKTRPPVAIHADVPPATAPATRIAATMPAPAAPAPRLEINKFVWHGVHVHLDDEAVTPAQSIGIDDVGVELTDLRLGLDPQDYARNSGKIKAWLAAPHFVDRFELNGDVTPGPKALQVNVNGAGSGISPSAIAPYLSSLGLSPLTTNGTLNFHAQVSVAHQGEMFNAGLSLDQVRYVDPSNTLLAVDVLKVGNIALSGNNIGVTDVEVDHPQARIERDPKGNLIVAGIKLVAAAPIVPTPNAVPPTTQPATTQPAATQPLATPASDPLTAKLNALHVKQAQIWWIDHAVSPDVNTSLTADVDLQHLTTGQPGAPADIHIIAAVPEVIKQLDVAGQVSPAPETQSAHLRIAAGGIVVGPLSSYLPPGITSTLKAGSLKLTLDAAIAKVAAGGHSAKLTVDELDYRDGDSPAPLFVLGNLTLAASRIDPPGGVIAIDELSTRGIACDVTQLPGGKTRLLGVQIAPVADAPSPAKGQAAADAISASPAASSPTEAAPDAAALVAAARKALPLITVGKLDLNVSRFALIDGAHPSAAPLALENLQLQNKARIEWLGPDPESRPAAMLQLTTRVSPLADRLTTGIKASPFTRQPVVTLDLDVSGIHGDGLTKLSPDLQKTIDGSGMTNGQFAAHVDATLKLDRHSPIDFNLSHPYGVEFDLTNVKLRAAPDGPVLAGIDEVRSEGVHVIPATGDITIKTIELTNPNALLVRDTDGIHALGWVLKSQHPTTQPSTQPVANATPQPAQALASAADHEAKPQAAATQPASPRSEIKIDHIVASGMNVRIEDRTTKPVTVLPLTGLDLEIRDLSNLALYQDKPFRFNALINAGKVNVPARTGAGNEDRDLFSQLTASGKIGLYPELNGWAKVALSGFDLAGVTAEAATQSITLTKGAFDMDVNLHFEPANVINVQSKLIVTDLSLAEQPKGPIYALLKLPAPLDVCIGALEDADGSITLPVNFPLKDFKPDGIAGAAAGAVTSVVVVAVASAPIKVVNMAGNIFGLGPKKPGEEQLVTLDYAPGAIALESPEQAKLAELAQRMIKEPNLQLTVAHQFGTQDAQAVAVRANPSADEARGLAYRLRARKLQLSRLRSEVSGQAEAQLATFDEAAAAPTLTRLRSIDRDLAVTETALDRTYDMLRPGADRQADRRTRAAALEIASQRLDAVRSLLRSAGVPDVDNRVKLIRPNLDPSKTSANSTIGVQPVQTKG